MKFIAINLSNIIKAQNIIQLTIADRFALSKYNDGDKNTVLMFSYTIIKTCTTEHYTILSLSVPTLTNKAIVGCLYQKIEFTIERHIVISYNLSLVR